MQVRASEEWSEARAEMACVLDIERTSPIHPYVTSLTSPLVAEVETRRAIDRLRAMFEVYEIPARLSAFDKQKIKVKMVAVGLDSSLDKVSIVDFWTGQVVNWDGDPFEEVRECEERSDELRLRVKKISMPTPPPFLTSSRTYLHLRLASLVAGNSSGPNWGRCQSQDEERPVIPYHG